jgi:2-dehydro-3-deoxygluconokinase
MVDRVVSAYPNLRVVATTLRTARTATRNDWSAICWIDGELFRAQVLLDLEILDRVGGGDSFASGIIYGLLAGLNPEQAVSYGAAHGALAMTTAGDATMATLDEVARLASGVTAARMIR